jgi:hypothetical protein
LASGPELLFVALVTLFAPAVSAVPLLNGFGGPSGYGISTHCLHPNDNGSYAGVQPGTTATPTPVDLRQAFPNGLNLFGAPWREFYLNTNGNITFAAPLANPNAVAFPVESLDAARREEHAFTLLEVRAGERGVAGVEVRVATMGGVGRRGVCAKLHDGRSARGEGEEENGKKGSHPRGSCRGSALAVCPRCAIAAGDRRGRRDGPFPDPRYGAVTPSVLTVLVANLIELRQPSPLGLRSRRRFTAGPDEEVNPQLFTPKDP